MSIPSYGLQVGDWVRYQTTDNGFVMDVGEGVVLVWVDPWRVEVEKIFTEDEYWFAYNEDSDFEDTVVVPANRIVKVRTPKSLIERAKQVHPSAAG